MSPVQEPFPGDSLGQPLEQRCRFGHAAGGVGLQVGEGVGSTDASVGELRAVEQAAPGDGDDRDTVGAGRGGDPGRGLAGKGLQVQ